MSTHRPVWFYHAMALVTVIVWSFSYVHLVALAHYVSPAQLVVLRFEFSAAALAGILIWRRPKFSGLGWRDWILICAIGLASGPLYHLVLAWSAAEHRINASLMGLIIATIPIYVGILAWIFLGEKPTLRRVAGLALGVGGVAIVIVSRAGNHAISSPPLSEVSTGLGENVTLAGPLAVTLAAILAAVNTVMSRAARHAVGPVDLTALSGLIAISVCLAIHPFANMHAVLNMPWQGWWAAFYLGFIAIGLANLSWYAAVAGLQAGSVAMYLFVPSVLSALWAWLWQNNEIGWGYIAGSALVLLGLVTGASRSAISKPLQTSASSDEIEQIDEVFEESTLT
jgi:drug/metabolite transporter (DMT)-like permease